MLTIVQRGGATHEKPPEIVRGQASRLPWVWDGLCFAVPFNDATRDSARDMVANAAPGVVSNVAWTKDDRGNVAAALGQTSYITYPDNPAHNRPTTAITAYVRLRRAGQTLDQNGGIFSKRYATGSSPFMSWGILGDFNAVAFAAHIGIGGAYQYWEDGYTIPTTEWLTAVLRWRSGTAGRLDIFGARGDLRSTTVNGTAQTGSITYGTNQPILFNSGDDDSINNWADYSQGMLWSRYLTDVELQALVADPYGWYSPRRATIVTSSPYPFVFGGGEMRGGTTIGGLR